MHDHDHDHDHAHGHDHGHGHHHHEPQSYDALRTKAVESLLIEKGLITSELVDAVIRRYEQDLGPMNGARLVARAWVDPEFKRKLLTDARAAANEFGFADYQGLLVVTENTPQVHNVIVCTLCSCYPMGLLGLPPSWYKSFAYRSRVVIEPRAVLREFGLDVDDSVEIRVWDSSAEQRYMVLPERPAGTAGLAEAELAALVSRDALIGVARANSPALAGGRA